MGINLDYTGLKYHRHSRIDTNINYSLFVKTKDIWHSLYLINTIIQKSMIYNYTKCESVIAKIMADLDSTEVRQKISDIREWIFEAVDKIGAPMQYIKKESGSDGNPILEIQDNQVPIPSDLVILDGVAYSDKVSGPWIPMSTTDSVFREPHKHHNPDPHMHQPMRYKPVTSQSQFYTINGMKYIDRYMFHGKNKPEYFIKPGWIVTNQKKGFIKLAYKAIAVDERGYPLIPDLTSYQEAIYWYVVMKLTFPKFMAGKLGGRGVNNAQNVYFYTQQQWNFYRNQAYAEAMMPTADDMQNIKNDWNKLLPDWDGDDTFFKNTNKEQIVFNDYYNGY